MPADPHLEIVLADREEYTWFKPEVRVRVEVSRVDSGQAGRTARFGNNGHCHGDFTEQFGFTFYLSNSKFVAIESTLL